MSLSASVGVQIPTNVIEVGNEISQTALDAIAASDSPSNVNPLMTSSAVTGLGYIGDAPNDGSEYVRKNAAWAVATGGGSVAWGGITGTVTDQTDLTTYISGLGYIAGTAASQLTNATYATNPVAAPTTAGDVLQFDGTALVWAAGGGGGGAVWGGVTGTLSDQTDLQTELDTKLEAKTVRVDSSSPPLGIAITDNNNIVYLNQGAGGMGGSTTIDIQSSTAYPGAMDVVIVVDTLGQYGVQPTGGVTLNGSSGNFTLNQYVSKLVKVATDTWYIT